MEINTTLGPAITIRPEDIFFADNAASTSSAGLATTYTGGVCLQNPPGSRVYLIPLKISSTAVVITTAVTSAGVIVGYAPTGITTHTTPLRARSVMGATGSSSALVDQACTLTGTPRWAISGFASTGIAAGVWGATIDVFGRFYILPGGYIATGTSVASAATGVLASIMWAEVLLP